MEQIAGIGTTAVFLLAALVWLAYLVPVWMRQREYVATERNAVRLQQTLRIMAQTAEAPDEVHIAADAREIARQQRLVAKEARLQQAIRRAEAVAKAKELDDRIKRVEREVKAAVAGSVTRRERLRRTRLACTAMLVVSLGVIVAGAWMQAVLPATIAGVVLTLAVVGLVAVNRSTASLRLVARTAVVDASVEHVAVEQPARAAEPEVADFASRSWTPVPVPSQRTPARAPIDVLREVARRSVEESGPLAPVTQLPAASFDELVAGGDTAEHEVLASEQVTQEQQRVPREAARAIDDADADESAAVAPSTSSDAFATMGVVDDDGDVLDIGAALRRRRAS